MNRDYGAGQRIPVPRKLYLRVNQRVEPGVAVDLLFFQRIKPAVGCGRKLRQLLDGDCDVLNGFFKGLFEPILQGFVASYRVNQSIEPLIRVLLRRVLPFVRADGHLRQLLDGDGDAL
jgi:hypothetical protein